MPSWFTRILIAGNELPFGWALADRLGKKTGILLAEKNVPTSTAKVVASWRYLAESNKKEFLELLKYIESKGVEIPERRLVRTSIADSIALRARFLEALNFIIKAYLAHFGNPNEFND